MSLEAVQKVAEAEQLARERKAGAIDQAKQMVSEAERQGQQTLSTAHAEAEAQAKAMMAKAEAAAADHSAAVIAETQTSCDKLRKSAEDKLDNAAELIIRRVVGV